MKSILIVLFLKILFITSLSAQTNLDSLRSVWEDELQTDSVRIKALNKYIYQGHVKTRSDSVLYYSNIQITYAEEKGFQDYHALGYVRLCLFYRQNGAPQKAIKSYRKALELYEELGDEKRMARTFIDIGYVDWEQHDYEACEANNIEALKIHQKIAYKKGIASSFWELAAIHVRINQYALGIEEYCKSLELHRELKDTAAIGGLLNNIGGIYKVQGNYSKALEYFEEAQEIVEIKGSSNHNTIGNIIDIHIKNGDYTMALNCLNDILEQGDRGNLGNAYNDPTPARRFDSRFGDVYAAQGNYTLALDYYKSAWESAKKDSSSLSDYEEKIGLLYLKMGKGDLAVEWCTKALEGSISVDGQGDACECLYQSYKSIDNYDKSLEYFELFQIHQDSLHLEETTAGLKQMEYTNKILADSLLKEEEKLKIVMAYQTELGEKDKTMNIFIIVGLIILFIAFGLWARMRFVRKANALLQVEKDRAEKSEHFKHQFLANMSHEIRTPMNAIKGMSDILIRRNPKPNQEEYLKGIKESSASLLVIINDILDLSKIEVGKIDFESIDFSISDILSNVDTIMQFKAEEKGLQLKLNIPKEIPQVLGDPTRLRQVIINLMGNAIKFTEKGIVTTTLSLETNEDPTISNFHFIVSDTGIGIDEKQLEQVFNSFEQAYSDTSRKYGGTGLGLSISKKLVELQGGKIWVESTKGVGSKFHFIIPYLIGEEKEVVLEEATTSNVENIASQLKGVKILLAEDNAFNAVVAREELEDAIEDVLVVVAEDGAIAVEQLSQNNFDLILMDIQMPNMNGYEATKVIRAVEGEKSKIPIIAMTANVMKEEVDMCYKAGMDDFIGKPFETEELLEKIHGQLQGQS